MQNETWLIGKNGKIVLLHTSYMYVLRHNPNVSKHSFQIINSLSLGIFSQCPISQDGTCLEFLFWNFCTPRRAQEQAERSCKANGVTLPLPINEVLFALTLFLSWLATTASTQGTNVSKLWGERSVELSHRKPRKNPPNYCQNHQKVKNSSSLFVIKSDND